MRWSQGALLQDRGQWSRCGWKTTLFLWGVVVVVVVGELGWLGGRVAQPSAPLAPVDSSRRN